LADEDTRYFGVPRREGSGATSFNSVVRGEKPDFTVHGSLASLRSVGAMLGISTPSVLGSLARVPEQVLGTRKDWILFQTGLRSFQGTLMRRG